MRRPKTYHFRCYVDDLDYSGHLTNHQYFTVKATSLDDAFDLAEDVAEIRCTDFGRVFEYTLDYINLNYK